MGLRREMHHAVMVVDEHARRRVLLEDLLMQRAKARGAGACTTTGPLALRTGRPNGKTGNRTSGRGMSRRW
jgi:hypothetical protein